MIQLQPTRDNDLEYVLTAEIADENKAFVGHYDADGHRSVIQDKNKLHLMVKSGSESVGYMIMEDIDDPTGSLQLRRMGITKKRRGHGRAALEAIADMAFNKLGAKRLWLDVFEKNSAAIALYRAAGYVEERRTTGCVKGGGQDVMIIMSLAGKTG